MEVLIPLVLGILIAGLGIYMAISGDVRLLHSYHYATTPADKQAPLARTTGICLAITGAGVMFLTSSSWLSVVGTIALVLGIAGMLAAIVHYNGSLFSTGLPAWGNTSLPHGVTLLIGAILGTVVSLLGIVPGAIMIATGDVSMLHSYHYVNVTPANLPHLATAEGSCMIILGIAVFLAIFGGVSWSIYPSARWPRTLTGLSIASFVVGLAGLLGFIIIFNGSLMG